MTQFLASAFALLVALFAPDPAAAAERPRFLSIHAFEPEAAQVERALRNDFDVADTPIKLVPPVDWEQDPHSDRSWRFWLHSMTALEPLLQHYERTGDLAALRVALDLTRDWIAQNHPPGRWWISEFAWYDMAVAARAAYFSYLYLAATQEGALSADDAELLRDAVVAHAEWLADDDNYKHRHNHGLYSDAGLKIVATQLASDPRAAGWARIAEERFVRTTRATVHWEEGIHLEHSPAYHELVTELIGRLNASLDLGGPALADLGRRMAANAAWFVMPDGRYAQFGDTDLVPAPAWVLEHDASARGFRAFPEAGTVVYRGESSYLMSVAWYHSAGHKHSDELSFVWGEAGRRIIIDTGRYGYYYREPGRLYAESSPGHNTLTLDTPFTWRKKQVYGSAIEKSGTRDGWHFVSARNPLLEARGATHRRTLLYQPGAWLIVIDDVGARSCVPTVRRFHFAPDFAVDRPDPQHRVRAEDPAGAVWLIGSEQETDIRTVRGRREPTIQGFTYPSNREWVESSVVELRDDTCRSPLVAGFALASGDAPPSLAVSKLGDSGPLRLDVRAGDGTRFELNVAEGELVSVEEAQ